MCVCVLSCVLTNPCRCECVRARRLCIFPALPSNTHPPLPPSAGTSSAIQNFHANFCKNFLGLRHKRFSLPMPPFEFLVHLVFFFHSLDYREVKDHEHCVLRRDVGAIGCALKPAEFLRRISMNFEQHAVTTLVLPRLGAENNRSFIPLL